eukprot:12857015-Heterocapsa_arctica.AAC.1
MITKKNLKGILEQDLADEYSALQLKEFDGKKLKFRMKVGLDIHDEDEKNKPKKLKMKFKPSMKLTKDVLSDM